jgi:plastocyanin
MKRMLIAVALAATSSVAGAQAVTVTLSEFKLVLSRDTVKAGPVTFNVKNTGAMTHGLYVRGPGVAKGSPDVASRQELSLTVTLKPGTYEVYCPMSDNSHKLAGMTHNLVVIAAAPAAPAKKPGG